LLYQVVIGPVFPARPERRDPCPYRRGGVDK